MAAFPRELLPDAVRQEIEENEREAAKDEAAEKSGETKEAEDKLETTTDADAKIDSEPEVIDGILIPSEVSDTTPEEAKDSDADVDTTMLLVQMNIKRQKKKDRTARREARIAKMDEATDRGVKMIFKKTPEEIAAEKAAKAEAKRLAAEEAEKEAIKKEMEENRELTIDEKLALQKQLKEKERAEREAKEAKEREAGEDGEAKDPDADKPPVDSLALLMGLGKRKKTPEEEEADRLRKEEDEKLEAEARKRAEAKLKKAQLEEEGKALGKKIEEEDDDESEEESEADEKAEDGPEESTDEETLTEDQKLKRRLKKRQKEMKEENKATTPKVDRSSAAGLQESIRKQLEAADEEEQWLQQEFEDLTKAAKKKREEEAAREVAEAERIRNLPPEERELVERARRGDEPQQVWSDLDDENDPLGTRRQLRKKPKKSALKKISTIANKNIEGTGFQTPTTVDGKKSGGVRFAPEVMGKGEDSDDSASEKANEAISDLEDSDYTDTEGETEGSEDETETEGETDDDYTSGSETNSEDDKEREALTDEVFSSKLIESKKLVSAPGIPLHSESDARVVFKIRDPDAHAIAALRREFKDCPEVQISCGEYFKDAPTCDALVIPLTNAFGFMDQPPELQYQNRFAKGQLQERLRATIVAEEDGELLVGDGVTMLAGKNIKALDTVQEDLNGGKPIRYVICVPIMRVPMFIQDTCNAYMVMRAIVRQIRRHNMLAGSSLPAITSVCIPALCAGGFARMPPARIAKQMKMGYEQWVLERHQNLTLAQDLGELATAHVNMSTFKTGHQV